MKKYILIVTTILIIILSTILVDKKNNKLHTHDSEKNITAKYYNREFVDRYKSYAKLNPNLSMEDIIIRVNVGLDYEFYTHTKKAKDLNKTYILVNKYNYLSEDYIPDNLEFLSTKYSKEGMRLVGVAKNQFEKMFIAAKKDNVNIRVISSYRSYLYQIKLYNKYKLEDGEEKADTYSARPGFSEHQTGLVVDIDDGKTAFDNFENSESYAWMMKNAYKYGFIERYPKDKEHITGYEYEAWHYRYVGKKIAKYIHENNITFDEYYAKFIYKNKNYSSKNE